MTRVLLIAACCAACAPHPGPEDPASLPGFVLSSADSAAIRSVAVQAGIHTPSSLGLSRRGYFVGCPVAEVVSDTIVDGDRRTWTELTVYREGRYSNGDRCRVYRPRRATTWRAKPWVANSALRDQRSTWRIHDAGWYVDVALGSGVPYEEATTIVRAIRNQTLVNHIPAVLRRIMGDTLPVFDADAIHTITRATRYGTYTVSIGGWAGQRVWVSLISGNVVVHNIGSYIS